MERTRLQRSPGRELLFRIVDGVFAFIHFDGAFRHVRGRAGVRAEATNIQLPHVVTRLPLHDPLSRVFACTPAEDDTENAEAGQNVKSWKTRYRPH